MKISDLIKMGLGNLWRRKMRTALTVLGVVVGSVSVVLMMSIALGTEQATINMMESIGNIRVVDIQGQYGDDEIYYMDEKDNVIARREDSSSPKLNDDALEQISKLSHVTEVVPFYSRSIVLNDGKYSCFLNINGCDLTKMKALGLELGRGSFPEKGEKAIIGFPDMGRSFYDPKSRPNPNEEIVVEFFEKTFKSYYNSDYDGKGNKKKPIRLKVVGETKQNTEYSWEAFMDIDLFKTIRQDDIKKFGNYQAFRKDKNRNNYNIIKVLVDKTENVLAVNDALKELGYNTRNRMQIVDELKKQTDIMKYVLGGIGAVSLFVAAIGITNTMVMAIYERTREIGVMKVLGSDTFDILKLFLFEAAMIGFIGGLIGIGLSYLGSNIINDATKGGEMFVGGSSLSYIPVWLTIGSLFFSSMIGIVAGLIPAIRATHLSALEAIKSSNS